MLNPIIFWGSRGHAKVLREILAPQRFSLAAIFDNDPQASSPFADIRLHIGWEGFRAWRAAHPQEHAFLLAIGGDRGGDRLELHRRLVEAGLRPVSIIHPSAAVSPGAQLGAGTQVLAHATVCVEAITGIACIINTAAIVDHESVLGDGVHIAPGATITGCVTIGHRSMIGANAVVLPRVAIGNDVIVGAGAVVTSDLPDGVVAYGVPARIIRQRGAPAKEQA